MRASAVYRFFAGLRGQWPRAPLLCLWLVLGGTPNPAQAQVPPIPAAASVQAVADSGEIYSLMAKVGIAVFVFSLFIFTWLVVRMKRKMAWQTRALHSSEIKLRSYNSKLAAQAETLKAQNERLQEEITERTRIAEELARSQARIRKLFDIPLVGMAIETPGDQRFLEINAAFCAMLGYAPEELARLTWAELTHADDLPVSLALLERMRDGGSDGEVIEKRYLRKDGGILYAQSAISCVRDGAGRVEYIMVVVQDIGLRKEAERTLREYNAQLAAEVERRTEEVRTQRNFLAQLMDTLPQLVLWKDARSVIRGGNRRVLECYGLSDIQDVVGKTDHDFFPAELAAQFQERDREVLASGQAERWQVQQVRMPDGDMLWLETDRLPLRDAAGKIDGVLVIAEDVSERVAAETKLRASEERFDLAMRGANDGLWDWDLRTNEVYYSPRWKGMLGYAEDDIPHRVEAGLELLHPEDAPKVQALVEAYTQKQCPDYEIVFRMRHKQGHYVWLLSRAFGVWSAAGECVRLVGTHMDISAQKESEAKLRRSESRLKEAQRLAKLGYWEWDILADVMHWSGGTAVQFGFSDEPMSVPLETFIQSVHPEDRARVRREFSEAQLGDRELSSEFRIIRGDHSLCYVQTFGKITRNATGQPVSMLGTSQNITARKQMERAFRQTESSFRAIFNNAAVAIAMLDDSGRFLQANQCFADLLGHSLPELLQLRNVDITHPEDIPESQDKLRQLLAGEIASYQLEKRYVRKDGSPLWMNLWVSRLASAVNATPPILLGIGFDITQRKQIELALSESEKRFREMADSAPVFIWLADAERRCAYVNKYWLDFTGRKLEQELGDGWLEGVHPEDARRCRETYAQAFAARQTFRMEYRLRRHDGAYRWLLDTGIPRYRENGAFDGYIGSALDLTEQRLALEALQESRLRLAEAQEMAHLGNWDWDIRSGEVRWSAETYRIYGLDPAQEPMPHIERVMQLVHPEDLPALRAAGEQCIRERGLLNIELRTLHADGQVRYIHSLGRVRYAEDGTPLRFVGTVQDITHLKEAELRLQQARDAAEAANRAKSAFLAHMSHELRTPLNGILGYAQILHRDPGLGPEQQTHVDIIRRNGDYLLALINDILDLSKIEAGRFELFPGQCELPALFAGTAELFRPQAQEKGIAFQYAPQAALPAAVYADEKRLRQILVNLLSNAVKFTRQGGVTLETAYRDGHLTVRVRDTGIGMSPEQMERIFEPFHQEGENTYKLQGSGLGLALTHKLVEMMGGSLGVDSEPGQGSVFSVELPLPVLSDSLPPAPAEQAAPRRVCGYVPAPGRGEYKVLIVDDLPENRWILGKLLTPIGFSVREAVDGQDCLQQAQDWLPDVILLDLVMPELDGLETARQLRALPALREALIIAVSARAFAEDQAQCLAAGCQAHLSKPVSGERLLETLRAHLGLTWRYSEDAPPARPGAAARGLSAEQAARLRNMAKRGDIQGIRDYLVELRKTLGAAHPLLQELERHAGRFATRAIRQLAERSLTAHPPETQD